MIIFLTVLFVFLSLICIVLFATTRVIIEYYGGELTLNVRILFFRFKISGSKLRQRNKKQKEEKMAGSDKEKESGKNSKENNKEKTPERFFEKINAMKEKYREYKDIINIFLSSTRNKIEFSKVYIGIAYGTGEAATTGLLYGAFWVLVGNVHSFISRQYRAEFPNVKLSPSYNSAMFEIEAEGIISLKLVHIITALLRVFKQIRKNKQKN